MDTSFLSDIVIAQIFDLEEGIVGMAYIALNYSSNPNAAVGDWVCSPNSKLGPFKSNPTGKATKDPDYCGQCVSFVKQVCSDLPGTGEWKKGVIVKGNKDIKEGTVIATFNGENYHGHAAIYVKQDPKEGITVFDQWCSGKGKSIGQRKLGWDASGASNNGSGFYIVEKK